MGDRPKIIYQGDPDRCEAIEDIARLQMENLKRDMSFQGLKIGGRRMETESGEFIECKSAHGQDVVTISAPESPVTEGAAGTIMFELHCSNGEPVTINRLSYLVLYTKSLMPVYVYEAGNPEGSNSIVAGGEEGNVFTADLSQIPEAYRAGPFWAFYACHEDTEKWGSGKLVRNGIRTQWPFRYRTEHQFRDEDMVFPGNLYRDVIPYGCFKFDIYSQDGEGETVEMEAGLRFEVFDQEGDNVNRGNGVGFTLSRHEDNTLTIYNKQIHYPDRWPRHINTVDGEGFWVFILDTDSETSGEDGADGNGSGIRSVDRSSRCDCEAEDEEDEEEEDEGDELGSGPGDGSAFPHISDIMADGRLQYHGKCQIAMQGKKDDLIPPREDKRTDFLCEGEHDDGGGTDMADRDARNHCGHWLCIGLMREYDMAPVTPDMLTHFAVTPVGGISGGGFVDDDTYEEITGDDGSSFHKEHETNSKGMGFGYGHDMNLEENCWTVVLPGVCLDWDGKPVSLWLLKPMSEEESEDYKNREDDEKDEDESRHDGMNWLPYSKPGPIYFNERNNYFEIYLGAHPANAYWLSYNCERGIYTMFKGVCCFEGEMEPQKALVSEQGGNYYFDRIPSNTIRFKLKCCGEAISKDKLVKSTFYSEEGKLLRNKYLSYSEKTGFWETTIGSKRACSQDGCGQYGVYIVVASGKCKRSLYGAECTWDPSEDSVLEGELLKPGEYDFELCSTCPTCANLIEIDGYSLDEYKDNVHIESGGSVTLTFESCAKGPCPDFVENLGDGLPESKRGTFEDQGGDGETYTVKYTASSNLCNEYDAGVCPSLCGYTIPCCCHCDEDNPPSLEKIDCNPDSCLGKYKVTPGCPGFSVQRRDKDEDGNWSDWYDVEKSTGCDWSGEDVSACWFCYPCDCTEEVDGCPDDEEFEIKVIDSMDRESNSVSSTREKDNVLYDPPEPDPDNPETVDNEDSVSVSVINGWGPFSWEFVSGEDASLKYPDATGRDNVIEAGPDACGPVIVKAKDDCGKETQVSVRILNGEWKLIGNYCGLSTRDVDALDEIDLNNCEDAQQSDFHPGRWGGQYAKYIKGHQKQEEWADACACGWSNEFGDSDPPDVRCDSVTICPDGTGSETTFSLSHCSVNTCITPGHKGCQSRINRCSYKEYGPSTETLEYYEWSCPES